MISGNDFIRDGVNDDYFSVYITYKNVLTGRSAICGIIKDLKKGSRGRKVLKLRFKKMMLTFFECENDFGEHEEQNVKVARIIITNFILILILLAIN